MTKVSLKEVLTSAVVLGDCRDESVVAPDATEAMVIDTGDCDRSCKTTTGVGAVRLLLLSGGWLASFDLSTLVLTILLPLVEACGSCDSLQVDETVVAGFGLDGFSPMDAVATTIELFDAVAVVDVAVLDGVGDVVVVEDGVGVLQAGVGEATFRLVGLGVLGRR